MTASITKIGKFNKTGKDLLGSGYGQLEKNMQALSLGNGVWRAVLAYDFAVDGALAAVSGSKNLRIAGTNETFYLPIGAQILTAYVKVDTTFTSATDAATVGLGIPTDDVAGIKAATAISAAGDYWDASGKVKATIQDGTAAAASEITTAERAVVIINTHATEATTAGALKLVIHYVDLAA